MLRLSDSLFSVDAPPGSPKPALMPPKFLKGLQVSNGLASPVKIQLPGVCRMAQAGRDLERSASQPRGRPSMPDISARLLPRAALLAALCFYGNPPACAAHPSSAET